MELKIIWILLVFIVTFILNAIYFTSEYSKTPEGMYSPKGRLAFLSLMGFVAISFYYYRWKGVIISLVVYFIGVIIVQLMFRKKKQE